MSSFKDRLRSIEKVFNIYMEDTLDPDLYRYKPYIRLKQRIILQALEDLYCGTMEESEEAIEYFKSEDYRQHAKESCIPPFILDRMIRQPSSILGQIVYPTNAIEDDLLFSEGL